VVTIAARVVIVPPVRLPMVAVVVAVKARRLVMPVWRLPPAVLVPAVMAVGLGALRRAAVVPAAVMGLRAVVPVLRLGAGHAHTEQQREERCTEADESSASHVVSPLRPIALERRHAPLDGRSNAIFSPPP